MTIPCAGQWTSGFDETRGDRIHGAQDIVAPRGAEWHALMDGRVMWHKVVLQTKDRNAYNVYGRMAWMRDTMAYPFANYTLEVYGCCAVLVNAAETEMWVYAHMDPVYALSYMQSGFTHAYYHKKSNEEWIDAQWTDFRTVKEGDVIGNVGYAGQTLPDPYQAHLHIEGHHGLSWNPHANRIRLDERVRRT